MKKLVLFLIFVVFGLVVHAQIPGSETFFWNPEKSQKYRLYTQSKTITYAYKNPVEYETSNELYYQLVGVRDEFGKIIYVNGVPTKLDAESARRTDNYIPNVDSYFLNQGRLTIINTAGQEISYYWNDNKFIQVEY